jgi:4-amino-4-deoxy-L-arabinose transferase-like glycosyltransferase
MKQITFNRRLLGQFLLGLFILLAAFLVVRLYRLDSLPVFVDEAIYVRWSQVMRAEPTLRFLPLSDGKQPLYMWLSIPFLKLISDPLVAGRVVSVLSGVGTVVGLALFGWLLTGKYRWGLLAGAVYLVLPFAHFFDRMALADGLLSLFGVWSLLLGWLLTQYRRLDLALILGFVLGGAVLTKSPGWVFLFLQPLLWLAAEPALIEIRGKQLRLKWFELGKLGLLFLVAASIAGGMYQILRLGPNFHMIALRNQDYVFSLAEILAHPANPLIGNLKDTFAWLVNLITPAGLILAAFSLRRRRVHWALWLWILVPLFGQAAIAKAYTSRYFFYVTPFVAILITLGVARLWEYRPGRRLAVALGAVLLIMAGRYNYLLSTDPARAGMPQNMAHGYLQEWTAGWGQKQVAEYLVERAADRSVVVGTDGYFGTLPDGLQIYAEKVPNLTVIGVGVSFDKIPPQLEEALGEHEVYFVVNQSRNRIPAEVIQARLELIERYPKPERPDGSRESLEFYRLKADERAL